MLYSFWRRNRETGRFIFQNNGININIPKYIFLNVFSGIEIGRARVYKLVTLSELVCELKKANKTHLLYES